MSFRRANGTVKICIVCLLVVGAWMVRPGMGDSPSVEGGAESPVAAPAPDLFGSAAANALVKIDGIQGEDRGSTILLGFSQTVQRRTDPHDQARFTGDRQNSLVTIVKAVDGATPLLHQAVVEGRRIRQVEVAWYRLQPNEEAEQYFTYAFKDCVVASVRDYTDNSDGFRFLEAVTFGCRQIVWKSETTGTEYADDLRR